MSWRTTEEEEEEEDGEGGGVHPLSKTQEVEEEGGRDRTTTTTTTARWYTAKSRPAAATDANDNDNAAVVGQPQAVVACNPFVAPSEQPHPQQQQQQQVHHHSAVAAVRNDDGNTLPQPSHPPQEAKQEEEEKEEVEDQDQEGRMMMMGLRDDDLYFLEPYWFFFHRFRDRLTEARFQTYVKMSVVTHPKMMRGFLISLVISVGLIAIALLLQLPSTQVWLGGGGAVASIVALMVLGLLHVLHNDSAATAGGGGDDDPRPSRLNNHQQQVNHHHHHHHLGSPHYDKTQQQQHQPEDDLKHILALFTARLTWLLFIVCYVAFFLTSPPFRLLGDSILAPYIVLIYCNANHELRLPIGLSWLVDGLALLCFGYYGTVRLRSALFTAGNLSAALAVFVCQTTGLALEWLGRREQFAIVEELRQVHEMLCRECETLERTLETLMPAGVVRTVVNQVRNRLNVQLPPPSSIVGRRRRRGVLSSQAEEEAQQQQQQRATAVTMRPTGSIAESPILQALRLAYTGSMSAQPVQDGIPVLLLSVEYCPPLPSLGNEEEGCSSSSSSRGYWLDRAACFHELHTQLQQWMQELGSSHAYFKSSLVKSDGDVTLIALAHEEDDCNQQDEQLQPERVTCLAAVACHLFRCFHAAAVPPPAATTVGHQQQPPSSRLSHLQLHGLICCGTMAGAVLGLSSLQFEYYGHDVLTALEVLREMRRVLSSRGGVRSGGDDAPPSLNRAVQSALVGFVPPPPPPPSLSPLRHSLTSPSQPTPPLPPPSRLFATNRVVQQLRVMLAEPAIPVATPLFGDCCFEDFVCEVKGGFVQRLPSDNNNSRGEPMSATRPPDAPQEDEIFLKCCFRVTKQTQWVLRDGQRVYLSGLLP